MGKEGDLWDDSALINAFNDAVSKYKVMHGKKAGDDSNDKGEVVSSSGDHYLADIDHSQEAGRQGNADEEDDLASNPSAEVGESSDLSLVQENRQIVPQASESYAEGAQENVQKGYSYSQGTEDYNQLLNQYYELEEKRQKILEQLQQFGSWNYQGSCEGSGWVNDANFQGHYQVPATEASNPAAASSCCPYFGQCLVTPCSSVPCCYSSNQCVGSSCIDACGTRNPMKSSPQEDSNIVETAMAAAEKALSSMGLKTSGDSNGNEAIKEKEKEQNEGLMVQSTSSETDLSAVLTAWYSAGVYTGKYLVEQSIAKKRQS
ncbi:hypothetical protein UlMin_001236 [Ulmus minor]